MARVIKKTEKGPMEIKGETGKSHWICMCGLSKNQPFCDGNHKKALDEVEGKNYKYNEDGTREEAEA